MQTASGTASPLRSQPGDTIGGYVVRRVEPLDQLRATFVELVHEPTGAVHLHIEPESDPSMVFVVDFPTNPSDSTGVAHILEHVALGGSEHFPHRTPFFSMSSRSVRDF